MGKTLSVDSSYGQIQLVNVRKEYHTGQSITGEVIVNLIKEFPSNTLHLVLKGQEKVKLAYSSHHGNSHHTHTVKEKAEIYYQTFPLVFNGPCFPVGSHRFPFNINLPMGMPPSLEIKFSSHCRDCYGKVRYKLTAVLQTPNKSSAIYDERKIDIIPSPNPSEMRTYDNLEQVKDKKEFKMVCQIDKCYVTPGTVINGRIFVDNSKSSSDIKLVKYKTIAYTNLKAKGHSKELRNRIDKTHLGGLSAGKTDQYTIQVPLNLPNTDSMENFYSYTGKLIQNRYVLQFAVVTPKLIFFSKENKVNFTLIVVGNRPSPSYPAPMPPPSMNQQPINNYNPGMHQMNKPPFIPNQNPNQFYNNNASPFQIPHQNPMPNQGNENKQKQEDNSYYPSFDN